MPAPKPPEFGKQIPPDEDVLVSCPVKGINACTKGAPQASGILDAGVNTVLKALLGGQSGLKAASAVEAPAADVQDSAA